LHKNLLRAEFGRAIEIHWIHRFVGAESQHTLNSAVDGGVDHVSAAHDIGLDGFERIVFARWNLLQSGSVDDDGNARESPMQPRCVANIAQKITQAGVVEAGTAHVMLLQFIAAQNHQSSGMVLPQHDLDELPAKRTRSPGNQNFLFGPIH
jgi:hypothetical protein